jgi:altronate hydrolase
MQAGAPVMRYGFPIGNALEEIQPGARVHSHNLGIEDFARDFGAPQALAQASETTAAVSAHFWGYERADGRVGTRNYIAVISAVNCVNPLVRAVQQQFTLQMLSAYPNVDGVLAITIDSGCSLPLEGLDHQNLRRVLLNIVQHPNIAASLVIGLGCEVNQMAEALAPLDVPLLVVQQEHGSVSVIRQAVDWVSAQLEQANALRRTQQPLNKLRVALQCGGSDAFSGITANPLVGAVSDQIVAQGGAVVIAETTEIFGAEQLLLSRCATAEEQTKLRLILDWWQTYTAQMGVTVDNNPSPGNKRGGLTTIFEKSLGAVSKCGTSAVREVLDYGERSIRSGVVFMDSPGNDAVSLTGQLAAGCNLVLFTTGCGSTYAPGIAPCLKIATTSGLYAGMTGDMDFNAGRLLEGQSMAEAANDLLALIINTASGAATRSDPYCQQVVELVPWRRGAIL